MPGTHNMVVAAHRKAIESTYIDECDVYEYKPVKDEKTKITSNKEVKVLENQPCKLSYESITRTDNKDAATVKTVSVKLFIAPEVLINAGSKIVVTHEGLKSEFSHSGESAHYETHQEIILGLFERWA